MKKPAESPRSQISLSRFHSRLPELVAEPESAAGLSTALKQITSRYPLTRTKAVAARIASHLQTGARA
ncbi:hypothetical protein AUJ65_00875 [Candidatus Micrarchaeota archaeon CG1_02_51_15]|nr:MAG: hypothetical protein AUJ65_00875 [Candidatus Micrarchaeota archaeon CG1_02_51_15]